MARPLLRGGRLQAARKAAGLTREELDSKLELSGPARIRVRETGLERPRPRFVPRLAAALGIDPLYLLDVDAGDPPLAALRLAAVDRRKRPAAMAPDTPQGALRDDAKE